MTKQEPSSGASIKSVSLNATAAEWKPAAAPQVEAKGETSGRGRGRGRAQGRGRAAGAKQRPRLGERERAWA